MKTTIIAIAAALMLATPAAKAGGTKAECQGIIAANGFLSHGSLICNPAWLDRLSSLDFAAGASECPEHSHTEGRRLLKLGFDKFDALIAKQGRDAACVVLDGKMSAQDKRVKSDPGRLAEAIMFEKNVAKFKYSDDASPETMPAALKYCANNPDARETGRDDESMLSVRACARLALWEGAESAKRLKLLSLGEGLSRLRETLFPLQCGWFQNRHSD